MDGKLLAIFALVLMIIENSTQAIELTTSTVVGNLLFEQTAAYALALMMLVVAVAM